MGRNWLLSGACMSDIDASFFKHLFTSGEVGVCHNMHVEVSEQLTGVGPLLSPCECQDRFGSVFTHLPAENLLI